MKPKIIPLGVYTVSAGKMLSQWETPNTVSSTIQSLLPVIEADIAALMEAVNS